MPDLTATLVAIAREQEAQRDRNIVDAWMRGGLFEGRQITDDEFLAYWRDKLDGVAKDDPLYDAYQNAVMQYEYAIAESKMTVGYAQGRIGDGQMAQFYLNWAKKVPRDSEFFRILQRDAAQYLNRARERGRAAAARAAAEKFERDMNALDVQQRPGQFVTTILTHLGQQGAGGHAAFLTEGFVGGPGEATRTTNIGAMETPAVDRLMWLIDQVNMKEIVVGQEYGQRLVEEGVLEPVQVRRQIGADQWIYTDDQGRRWTRGELHDELARLDPDFDGNFNLEYIGEQLRQQSSVLEQMIRLAEDNGYASKAANIREERARVVELGETLNSIPVVQRYIELRRERDEILQFGGTMPPGEQARRLEEILQGIGRLANHPSIRDDGNLQSRLRGEALLDPGTVTVWDDLTGQRRMGDTVRVAEAAAKETDLIGLGSLINNLTQMDGMLRDGTGILTQGRRFFNAQTGEWDFNIAPGGLEWGVVTPDDIAAAGLTANVPSQMILVPHGDGKGFTPATVFALPIYARIGDPAVAAQVQVEGGELPVGWAFQVPVGRDTVTSFAVHSADGSYFISSSPNFAPYLWEGREPGSGGWEIDISGAIQGQLERASPEHVPGTTYGELAPVPGVQGMFVSGRRVARVPPAAVVPVLGPTDPLTGQPTVLAGEQARRPGERPLRERGVIMVNLPTFVAGTDPTLKRGFDPETDTPSLFISMIRQMPEGARFLSVVQGTPIFDMILRGNLDSSVGRVYDDITGQYTMPPERTETLRRFQLELEAERQEAQPRMPVRDTPVGVLGAKHAFGPMAPIIGLGTDILRDRRDTRFGALSDVMMPRTTAVRMPLGEAVPGRIEVGHSLLVPGVPPLDIQLPEREPPPSPQELWQGQTRRVGGADFWWDRTVRADPPIWPVQAGTGRVEGPRPVRLGVGRRVL